MSLCKLIAAAACLCLLAACSTSGQTRSKFEPPDGRILHGFGMGGWKTDPKHVIYDDNYDYVRMANENGTPPFFSRTWWTNLGNPNYHEGAAIVEDVLANAIPGGLVMLSTSNFAQGPYLHTGEFDDQLDTLIRIFHRYAETPIILRIGLEFNLKKNTMTPEQYREAWRYMVRYFRAAGVDNVSYTWDYHPNKRWSGNHDRWMAYYPGDEFVDWWGLDIFDPCELDNEYEAQIHAFVNDARAHGKPVGVAECSPRHNGIEKWGDEIWEVWFEGFLDWLKEDGVKYMSMTSKEWRDGYSGWADWGDANITHNEYLETKYRERLREPQWIHQNTPKKMKLIGWDPKPTQPTAYFMALARKGPAPHLVQFIDLSYGFPDTWEWDFDGDGRIDSRERNPTFEIRKPGVYQVSLKSSNKHGADLCERDGYIEVEGTASSRNLPGYEIVNGDAETSAESWTDFIWAADSNFTYWAEAENPTGNYRRVAANGNHAIEISTTENRGRHQGGACVRIKGINSESHSAADLGAMAFRIKLPPDTLPFLWNVSFAIDLDGDGQFFMPGEIAIPNLQVRLEEGWNTIYVDFEESKMADAALVERNGEILAGFFISSREKPISVLIDDVSFAVSPSK